MSSGTALRVGVRKWYGSFERRWLLACDLLVLEGMEQENQNSNPEDFCLVVSDDTVCFSAIKQILPGTTEYFRLGTDAHFLHVPYSKDQIAQAFLAHPHLKYFEFV